MSGFLSHLVQRALAVSPAMMPRLAGPYEGARVAAVTRSGDGGEEAIATLRRARGQAELRNESSAAWVTGIPREISASSHHSQTQSAHRQPVATTMAASAERPVMLDLNDVQLVPRADAAAAATRLLHAPQTTAGALETEVSFAAHPPSYEHAPGAAQSSPAPSLPVANRWPPAVSPMLPPALRRGDSTAAQVDARTSLDEGESPRPHPLEPFGAPRFDPVVTRSRPDTQGSVAQSSSAPLIDPSSVMPTDGPKRGILIEPSAPPDMPQRPVGGAPQHAAPEPGAATTVHVTIGRIELRAAAPAAAVAPSRPATPRPALSLTDYLDRRTAAGTR